MLTDDRQALNERKAEIIAAIGHPIRLAAVEFLADGEQCVCDIAEHVGTERSNVSRHLAILVRAGVLDSRKAGLRMMYSLVTPCVLGFSRCVEGVLEKRAKDAARTLEAMRTPSKVRA